MGRRRTDGNSEAEVDVIIKESYGELEKLIDVVSARYTKNPSDRDDIRQVGWEYVVMRARHYNKENHIEFHKYVYAGLWHTASIFVKRQKRHEGSRPKDFTASSTQQADIIKNVVDVKLDTELRSIVNLKFYKDATLEEIAKATKLSVNQVRARLDEALEVLRREFAKVGITGIDHNADTRPGVYKEEWESSD